MTDEQLRRARNTAHRRVSALLTGSGLEVQEYAHELVITNPRDPEKGKIHVACHDGYVSWERVAWDYWGPLAGYEDTGETTARVGSEKILSVLTAATPLP
jgi:hypothetical protein